MLHVKVCYISVKDYWDVNKDMWGESGTHKKKKNQCKRYEDDMSRKWVNFAERKSSLKCMWRALIEAFEWQ